MSLMRWIGFLLGVVIFFIIFVKFRHARIRRKDFALGFLFSLSLIVVSVYPDSVSLLRDMMALKREQFSRLIALVIASSILLWLLVFSLRIKWNIFSDQFDKLLRRIGVQDFKKYYPELKLLSSVVVVIPAYNEEKNICKVLAQMPEIVCGRTLKTIVIDDGSQDNTLEEARKSGAYAISNPINRGGGAALRLGFDIASDMGAEIVVTMDGDGQHLPSEIERLVSPILAGKYDFVIGSRVLGEREKDSLIRWVGIHVFNFVIRMLSNVRITDCSNGFRAFRVSALNRVLLRQDQYHTTELIIDAAKKGIRIGETPVTVKRRLSGESKKGKNWKYGLNFARTVFKTWWR